MARSQLPAAARAKILPFLVGSAFGAAATFTLIRSLDGVEAGADKRSAQQRQAEAAPRNPATGAGSSAEDYSPQQAFAGLEDVLLTPEETMKESARNELIDRAAEFDAQGSFDKALGLTDPQRRREALERVLRTWVVDDREAALVAIGQVGNIALRRNLLRSAVASLSRSDPEGAVAILRAEPGARDDSLWQESFSIWAKSGPKTISPPRSSGSRICRRTRGRAR